MASRRKKSESPVVVPSAATQAAAAEATLPPEVPLDADGGVSAASDGVAVDEDTARRIGAVDQESARTNKDAAIVHARKRGGERNVRFNDTNGLVKYETVLRLWNPNALFAYVSRTDPSPIQDFPPISCATARTGAALYAIIQRNIHRRSGPSTYHVRIRENSLERGAFTLNFPDMSGAEDAVPQAVGMGMGMGMAPGMMPPWMMGGAMGMPGMMGAPPMMPGYPYPNMAGGGMQGMASGYHDPSFGMAASQIPQPAPAPAPAPAAPPPAPTPAVQPPPAPFGGFAPPTPQPQPIMLQPPPPSADPATQAWMGAMYQMMQGMMGQVAEKLDQRTESQRMAQRLEEMRMSMEQQLASAMHTIQQQQQQHAPPPVVPTPAVQPPPSFNPFGAPPAPGMPGTMPMGAYMPPQPPPNPYAGLATLPPPPGWPSHQPWPPNPYANPWGYQTPPPAPAPAAAPAEPVNPLAEIERSVAMVGTLASLMDRVRGVAPAVSEATTTSPAVPDKPPPVQTMRVGDIDIAVKPETGDISWLHTMLGIAPKAFSFMEKFTNEAARTMRTHDVAQAVQSGRLPLQYAPLGGQPYPPQGYMPTPPQAYAAPPAPPPRPAPLPPPVAAAPVQPLTPPPAPAPQPVPQPTIQPPAAAAVVPMPTSGGEPTRDVEPGISSLFS